MDSYEATRVVFSRIQTLDPENASKIMGLLLIQDHGDKEMIRLAFGPETLLHSLIIKARKELCLPPSTSPASTPSSPSPFLSSTKPISISISRQSSSSLSSSWVNSSSLVSSPVASSFPELPSGDDLANNAFLPMHNGSPSPSSFFSNGGDALIDRLQLPDQLSFLNDDANAPPELLSSPTGSYGGSAAWGGGSVHRRSFSVNDACANLDDGLGWRPCLYYARGFCKNGSSCKFGHARGVGIPGLPLDNVGSPREWKGQCHDQQRLAAPHLLNSSAFPYSLKSMNLFMQHQQSDVQSRAAAALMMGEEIYKLGRPRLERTDFALNGGVNPASRQIYLTFPSDSTFKEEDVSNYFSLYGPVQDVRIPYQQRRMFGFVTFVYPETVKLILAKGNPHFVCDARVLVKPYKEKGKVPDKFRKQQLQPIEVGEFSPCVIPLGLDTRAVPFDIPLGPRSFYNSQGILWRKRLEEQADLQQAIDLQSRRLLNLQLLDVKKHHHQRALSVGSPVPSPTHSPNLFNHTFGHPFPSSANADEVAEICDVDGSGVSVIMNFQPAPRPSMSSMEKGFPGGERGINDEESSNSEDGELPVSFKHKLPESAFALAPSPRADPISASFSGNSSMDMASFKTFNCQMPRFSSGHGAIGVHTGAGGPTCPVGL